MPMNPSEPTSPKPKKVLSATPVGSLNASRIFAPNAPNSPENSFMAASFFSTQVPASRQF